MVKMAIILGSTRPGRKGEAVAKWDEPAPPSLVQYSKAHTKQWAAKIAPFDGFVFVTPEYNHSTGAVLLNVGDSR